MTDWKALQASYTLFCSFDISKNFHISGPVVQTLISANLGLNL